MDLLSTVILLMVIAVAAVFLYWIPKLVYIGVFCVLRITRTAMRRRRLRKDQAHARVVHTRGS